MSLTHAGSVARLYLGLLAATLAGVTLVFLAVDFGDQQRSLADLPTAVVAELYGHRALIALRQLAPAAMLLAAGAAVSVVRLRGEWLALQALGVSPWQAFWPIFALGGLLAAGLVAFDDRVVTRAVSESQRIRPAAWQALGPAGDAQPRWFRFDDAILEVRGEADARGFVDVTVYELERPFALRRRLDAKTLRLGEDGAWRAEGLVVHPGATTQAELATAPITLPARAREALRVTGQRAEALTLAQLSEQQHVRRALGLPTRSHELTTHLRFAYPFTGVAAAALAVALALRPSRRGQLTLVLVDGVAISFLLVLLLAVGRTLVLNGRAAPAVAAWAPPVGLLLVVAALWAQGALGRRRSAAIAR